MGIVVVRDLSGFETLSLLLLKLAELLLLANCCKADKIWSKKNPFFQEKPKTNFLFQSHATANLL